ncbi:DegQ family serine endoprotease [Dyella sp.]|uniref:DegQ family serine endoprotease n=1 Tax=Dyella sp. TaxID=1869338 RepID=UPI002B4AA9D0|nr:DegQ family serine endoprotease [Dyella sp.]HKT28736.1 DegQ family serine endoprotease [Dyella sp.]
MSQPRLVSRRLLCGLLGCALGVGIVMPGPVAWAQDAPASAGLPDFTGIVQKNAPAVVHVEAKYSSRRPKGAGGMPLQGMDPGQAEIFRRFFGMPMMPSPEEQAHTSLGSGFIISSDGYILTNNHVVDHADVVTVRLQDRRTLTAKVVGTDPTYDIALLKVNTSSPLPAVTIGDSRLLKPGQWVLAIGSPFGFDYTVTQGIVSAVGRNLGAGDQPATSFIQTDVPINRGNSGGPLFNLQGQVVGINSQIYSDTGGYQGIAFSIPIDMAMNAVDQLKTKGYVTRGMLGVTIKPVDEDMVKALKLDTAKGAIVVSVEPNSAAQKAGLQSGDIILAYNGHDVVQGADLPPMVAMTKPGAAVPITILRDGKEKTIDATIGTMPRDQNALSAMGKAAPSGGANALGLSVENVDASTRSQLGLKAGEGVAIANVTGPVAAQAGLQQGDVILMVNQKKVASVEDFRAATAGVKPGDTVLLLVRRGDSNNFIALTIPSDKDE